MSGHEFAQDVTFTSVQGAVAWLVKDATAYQTPDLYTAVVQLSMQIAKQMIEGNELQRALW